MTTDTTTTKTNNEVPQYTKKDFVSGQEPRWCPGCGDFSILSAVQQACTKIGKRKEDICFISGIGCSSRFPYYMDLYGIHSIHGRAPAIATGVKLQNPNLSVWVATGDGDALSIGGNHFIHSIRKNIDLNIIIFNNEIYGLTKGQYSPTSQTGLVTKSSPYGAIDHPFSPAALSIGSGATFFARTLDTDPKHMAEVFVRAAAHKGISVVEILQNCVIFNDKVHDPITNRATRDENTLRVEHGKTMVFGANKDKGIILQGADAKIVNIADVNPDQLMVHNEHAESPFLANLLSSFHLPQMPVPLGIFRDVDHQTYDTALYDQLDAVTKTKGKGTMEKLLHSGDTWEIN